MPPGAAKKRKKKNRGNQNNDLSKLKNKKYFARITSEFYISQHQPRAGRAGPRELIPREPWCQAHQHQQLASPPPGPCYQHSHPSASYCHTSYPSHPIKHIKPVLNCGRWKARKLGAGVVNRRGGVQEGKITFLFSPERSYSTNTGGKEGAGFQNSTPDSLGYD